MSTSNRDACIWQDTSARAHIEKGHISTKGKVHSRRSSSVGAGRDIDRTSGNLQGIEATDGPGSVVAHDVPTRARRHGACEAPGRDAWNS